MKKHVKNQHYVPQFFLKRFHSSNINKIWCYDKIWKRSEERSIKGVACEKYFYDKNRGEVEGSLEYFIAKVESDAAPVIEKIIRTKNLLTLTDDEKVIIALFVGLQFCRTQSFLEQTERFQKELFEFIDPKYILRFNDTKNVWRSTFQDIPKLALILIKKHCFLLESNNDFYTSDNPLVLQNTVNNRPHRGNLGINSDGIEIYLPLSPSLVFCMFCERTLPSFPILYPCPALTVENLNSLQVVQSKRFVFSYQKKFELVKDMLAESIKNE